MKMCISIIHLGRYKIDILDNDNQIVRGYDCGLAGVLVALNNWIFVPGHVVYQDDQGRSSDELGREAITKMTADPTINPKGLTPPNYDKRFTLYALKDRPELNALIKKSVDAFNAMPIEKRREMRAAQAKSWVIGEMLLDHPNMTREEAERIYNEVVR